MSKLKTFFERINLSFKNIINQNIYQYNIVFVQRKS